MANNKFTGSFGNNNLGSPSTHGKYPYYETPVVADFNDLLYKMNVLARKWAAENYPEALLVMYEFRGWYKKQDPDDGMVTILLDEEHGMPENHSCRGVYTMLIHEGQSYSNIITVITYFSDSNLDSIYVEEWDSPFLESAFPGDWPYHTADMALEYLRDEKKDPNYFTEGWVTYRKDSGRGISEPSYQFAAESDDEENPGTFDTVGVNTMRVNVPADYDETIPHTPYPGIDDVPGPGPDPDKLPDDAERSAKTSYGKYMNLRGWQK